MTNQIELSRPAHIISLQSSCILVHIPVRVWTATKQDKVTAGEVTTAKNADPEAAKVTQHLLANNPTHKKLLNYRQTVYNWLERETYPWAAKQGALPVANLIRFMKQYEAHKVEFDKLVDEFLAAYPVIVSDMAFKMGDMFDRNNYPTVEELRTKFGMELYTSEIPSGDFRNALAQDLADDLHKTYTRQAEQMVKDILGKQAAQLVSVMESLSHCMDSEVVTDPDGSQRVRRRRIYDSTIQRALDLCNTFDKFNLTQSPELESARSALASVLQDINVETLRDSDTHRAVIKSGVDDILSKFGSFASKF